MHCKTIIPLFGWLTGMIPAAMGFSSDGSSVTRSFDRSSALTNSPIAITATFTNAGGAAVRGFSYLEQMPVGLTVSTLNVTVNGQVVTNYTIEFGQEGDVYAGCLPYRWVLERPAGFNETNPVLVQGGVQIVYSVSSSVPATFLLQQFGWIGYHPGDTNAIFGHSESTDQRSLAFTSTNDPPILLTGQYQTNAFVLTLTGQAGSSYVIEASPDLFHWVPLITNTSPFIYADTNMPAFSNRFYGTRSSD